MISIKRCGAVRCRGRFWQVWWRQFYIAHTVVKGWAAFKKGCGVAVELMDFETRQQYQRRFQQVWKVWLLSTFCAVFCSQGGEHVKLGSNSSMGLGGEVLQMHLYSLFSTSCRQLGAVLVHHYQVCCTCLRQVLNIFLCTNSKTKFLQISWCRDQVRGAKDGHLPKGILSVFWRVSGYITVVLSCSISVPLLKHLLFFCSFY